MYLDDASIIVNGILLSGAYTDRRIAELDKPSSAVFLPPNSNKTLTLL
jgi:hypothetical protein